MQASAAGMRVHTPEEAGLMASLGQVPWAIVDQMLISATNFATLIFLARGFSQAALGSFTIVYSVLLFLNSIQSGIITQPHNILGVSRRGEEYRCYTTSTGLSQLLLSGIGAALSLLAYAGAHIAGFEFAPLLLALAPAILAWQFQEFVRRVLYTEGRVAEAFATDLLGYGGQAMAIALLWHWQALSGPLALYVLSVASTLGGLLGLWRIRHSLSRRIDRAVVLENWHFGKWVAGGEIVGHWLSAQLFVYLSAAILGAAAAGVLRAVHTLFGPSRVLADVLCTVLPIRFARTLASSGKEAMHTQLVLSYLAAIPLLGGYCLLVAIFAKPLLWILYNDRYAGSATVLSMYAVAAFASYMTMIVGAALRAKRLTRRLFNSQLYSSLVALPIGWALITAFGIQGTVLGMLVTYLAMIFLFWRAYRGIEDAGKQSGEVIAAEAAAVRSGQSGVLLMRVFRMLDDAGIPYCVTHGYEGYPERIGSDVDCIMPANVVPQRLATLLQVNREELGARITQWVHEDTHYIVLSGIDDTGAVHHLRLDVSTDYELSNRVFLIGDEVLAGRRRHRQFWIPAPKIEFACSIIRRMIKGRLKDEHAQKLGQLYARDTHRCRRMIRRFWSAGSAAIIEHAAESGDWREVRRRLPRLRRELLRRSAWSQPFGLLRRMLARSARRLARWARPRHGLHVVFLGPDGAGKSSVVRAVQQDLSPAFFNTSCRSFPPALLNRGGGSGPNERPQHVAQRSYLSSVVRAIAYWWVYYALGHFFTVRIELARFHLVLHDRHLIDAVVDPKRYRYSGPRWLLELIWRFVPKPDLVLVLDAPADVIQSRKQEVPLEETTRQCSAYRSLAEALPMGRVVEASGSLSQTIASAERLIIDCLGRRAERQLSGERTSTALADVQAVLHRVSGLQNSVPLNVWELGAGDQAVVHTVRRCDGLPIWQHHREILVKLFKPKPEVALAVAEEFESLRRLQEVLNGLVIEGWRVHSPRPVLQSDAPPALVMTMVPGRSLDEVLADRTEKATHDSLPHVVAAALERYWAADGRIYGDLDLNNVLCDPARNSISLVDPGMPQRAYICSAVSRRWFPASRDLAYMLFDVAASVRTSLLHPRLYKRQRRLVIGIVRAVLRNIGSEQAQRAFLEELEACGRVHVSRIRVGTSFAGVWGILARTAATLAMRGMVRELLAGAAQRPYGECDASLACGKA